MEHKKFSKPTIELFNQWNDKNIVYCHWKSSDHLEASFLAQTDLDVLVGRTSANEAIRIALDCGFVELKSSHFRGYPSVRDFVQYDAELHRWVHLHFHTQLECGDRWVKAYHLPIEDLVLKNRVKHKEYNLWNIAPDYELLILIFRMNAKFKKNWLMDKKIQEEIKYIQSVANLYPSSIHEDLQHYLSKEGFALFDSLFAGNQEFSKLKIREFRREFKVRPFLRMSRSRFFFLSKLRYTYRVYTEVNRRYFKVYKSGRRTMLTGGLIFAFIGIDGSGKSSGIKRVEKFFAFHSNVQRNFLGSGKSGASLPRKLIMNVFGFKAKFKGHKELKKQAVQEPSKTSKKASKSLKKPPIYYLIWNWMCTVDRARQINRIRRGLANGKLVFVDRWLQDNLEKGVDGPRLSAYLNYGGLTEKIARKEHQVYQEIKTIPLHKIIKLNITPDKSVERKPGELTYEMAEEAIENLNKIQWPEQTQIANIDATQNIEKVTAEISKAIWSSMQEYK